MILRGSISHIGQAILRHLHALSRGFCIHLRKRITIPGLIDIAIGFLCLYIWGSFQFSWISRLKLKLQSILLTRGSRFFGHLSYLLLKSYRYCLNRDCKETYSSGVRVLISLDPRIISRYGVKTLITPFRKSGSLMKRARNSFRLNLNSSRPLMTR